MLIGEKALLCRTRPKRNALSVDNLEVLVNSVIDIRVYWREELANKKNVKSLVKQKVNIPTSHPVGAQNRSDSASVSGSTVELNAD